MKKDIEEIKRIIKEKVEGKIIPDFSVFGHFYKFADTGIKTASVTTRNILHKPHLSVWAAKLAIEFLEVDNRWERLKGSERDELMKGAQFAHTDFRDDAGNIGSLVHKAVEKYEDKWITTGERPKDIREFIESDDYRVYGGARSAEAAFDKYDVVPVVAEILVGIEGVGAGTLDLIVMNKKGELELWDHKTSNSIDIYYAAQTAAYKKFFEKMTGLKIKRIRIIKLDKYSNKYKIYNVTDIKKSYELFLACSKAYDITEKGIDTLIKEDKVIVKI